MAERTDATGVAGMPAAAAEERDADALRLVRWAARPLPRLGSWAAWEVLALTAISVVGLLLRLHGYAGTPPFTDNADELNWAWGGLNLILIHDAYTWSYFSAYPTHTILHAYGTTFPMVHHWLDHPPLFSLIVGAWLYLLGVRDMLSVTAGQERILPIAFSTTTIVLSYALGRRFLGRVPALVGVALLATSPGAVLFGRVTEAESLLAVVLLVALLATAWCLDGGGRGRVALLLGCCLVAPLLKVPGLSIAGMCAVILAANGRWRLAAIAGVVGVLGVVLYVDYGAIVDWQLFLRVWAEQADRRTGVMAGFGFITDAAGINRQLRDGWWLLGWLGIAILAAIGGRRPAQLFIAWPAAAYAAVMLLLAGETEVGQYGWYRIIIYPEVYLAAGWLAWEAVSRRSLVLLTMLLVLGGATATNWWLGGPSASWVPNPFVLVALVAAVLAPAVVAYWRRREPLFQRAALACAGAALAVFVIGNTVESLRLDQIFSRL